MYSESNRHFASHRTDDAFLRRMLGGQLTGEALSGSSTDDAQAIPVCDKATRTSCQGLASATQSTPACPSHAGECPSNIPAPSIAMVYAPRQCWRNLMDPATGLAHGSIFSELILPLECTAQKGEKEVKARRPM